MEALFGWKPYIQNQGALQESSKSGMPNSSATLCFTVLDGSVFASSSIKAVIMTKLLSRKQQCKEYVIFCVTATSSAFKIEHPRVSSSFTKPY